MVDAKKRLGRGLDALLSSEVVEGEGVSTIKINDIDPNPYQPRREFDQSRLEELAASIREHGVVQPLIVRRAGVRYQLVAGERRWRAARMAGLGEIPAVVRDLTDEETMEIALIENIQRQDLNPIEEARAYLTLMDSRGLTQEEVALRVGKSRPAVANSLRLLALGPEIQRWIEEGKLTAGHARALAGIEDGVRQREIARRVVEGDLNVRETEALARGKSSTRKSGDGKRHSPSGTPISGEVAAMAEGIQRRLGSRVRVRAGAGKSVLEIEFYGPEDLERLFEIIAGTPFQLD